MEQYVRKIGSIKKKSFEKDFDYYFEKYTNKSIELGYESNLKFNIEKGRVIVFVVI
jgi:hypothetical protein